MRDRVTASLVLLAGALSGCFSGSSSPAEQPPEPGTDAETTPTIDAMALDAGTVDATMAMATEAGLPEAAPEAAVEAGPAPVTVTIVNHLGPEPGVLIAFQDVTGHVVATGTTNALGQVTELLDTATQVTAVMGSSPPIQYTSESIPVRVDGVTLEAGVGDAGVGDGGPAAIPAPTDIQIVTVQGVEPGDSLSLVDPSDTTFSNATVVVDSLPDAAPPPNTESYAVQIGDCYDYYASFPTSIYLTQDCEANGVFPVLVTALGGEGSVPIGYTWQNGNTIPLDGGVAHVAMSGPWVTAFSSDSIAAQNVPFVGNQYVTYGEITDGVSTSSTTYVTADDAGDGLSAFTGHPGFAPAVQNEVMVSSNGDGWISVSAIATRAPFAADGGASFDLSTALPLINAYTIDAGASSDDAGGPEQPYVGWATDAGSLASASGVAVQINWNWSGPGIYGYGTWTIVAPPTATSVTAPMLPPQVAGWAPNANSYIETPPTILVAQSSSLPTYAAFRSQFATLPATQAVLNGNYNNSPTIPPLPANGTVRVSGIVSPGG